MEKNRFILLLLVLKEIFKRGFCAVVLSLVMVSMAHADAIFTLTALTPENSVGGYLPGTLVDFQVDISQDTGSNIELRSVQVDFSASNPGLTFSGDFNFDFSTLMIDTFYAQFPNYPRPSLIFTSPSPFPGFMLEIPTSGSLVIGTGQLQLPTNQGTYLLDPLNAGTTNHDLGAMIIFGFDYRTTWSSWGGSITGSPLALAVVPIPSAIWFLGSGLVGLMGLRRKFGKH